MDQNGPWTNYLLKSMNKRESREKQCPTPYFVKKPAAATPVVVKRRQAGGNVYIGYLIDTVVKCIHIYQAPGKGKLYLVILSVYY